MVGHEESSRYSVVFEGVTKEYPLYHHLSLGLKGLILKPMRFFKLVSKSKFLSLDNISFCIKKGECIGIIGRNGSGKSTSLSLIAGVLKPTKGNVIVNGRVAAMLELGGGFHPDLTGRENIILNAVLLGLTKKQICEKLDSVIEFSELGSFIDEPIRIYSSGMLARLGFSVLTSVKPDILIIDEVLAVGDAAFQKKCLDIISDFKKSGVTIIIVSHNTEDVKAYCDKVAWIENHKLKMFDDTKSVLPHYMGT
ncbi:ABC transporter ATP-binding protein [Aeromonas veronii]